MSTVGKATGGNRRRVAGAVAALAIGGATMFAPGGYAQAAPGDAKVRSGADRTVQDAVLPRHKMPKGAVRVTGEQPRPGSYGPAFQKPVQPRSVSPKIVGGAPANAADHPWIIGLQSYFLGEDELGNPVWYLATCTGSVLSPTKVLTAGHCVVGLPFGTTYAIAGRNDLDAPSGGFVARVSSAWTHQNFNAAALWNGDADVPIDDVSVLTLKDPLPDAYTPIALTAQGDQTPYAAGTEALILGYGITSSGTYDPGILRKATVPVQSDEECASALGQALYDNARMTCAGNPTQGIDTCNGDSGGPLVVNGVQAGITDWGYSPCGSRYGVYERLSYYSDIVKQDLTRPTLVNLDWTGDGHSDLVTRNSAGDLILHFGSGLASDGAGGFAGTTIIGQDFGDIRKLFRVTNWNGDGNPSLMAVTSSGELYQWTTDGAGGFTSDAILIGTGWNSFTDIMVTNDWMGDGRPNLMGRRSNGDLVIYTSNGAGGWINPKGTLIGTGWNSFDIVLTPGAWDGDGHQTLIGRRPSNGDLVLYKSNGAGGWINPKGTLIGTGWNSFKMFMSPGDWNGDNMVDLIGVTPAGAVRVYTTNGHGAWLNGKGIQIATGWNVYNTLF